MARKENNAPKKHRNNSRIPRKTPWTVDEVREMPTDKILATLHSLGISISMDDLREEVKEFCSAEDLSEHWFETHPVTATGWDEDFPWYAAWVLWERLDGDTIPYESITELMAEEYMFDINAPGGVGEEEEDEDYAELGEDVYDDFDAEDEDEDEEDLDEDATEEDEDEGPFGEFDLPESSSELSVRWMQLRAWDYIKALFAGKATSIEEAMGICSGASSLGEWCVTLVDNLGFEAASSPSLTRERLRFAREFCEMFPESDEEYIQQMRSAEAEALFALGRVDEADEVFRTIVQQWPDWTWGYIRWGDAYADRTNGHPEYEARAREIFNAALQHADEADAEVIRERLEDLGKS
ncbi:MAG: hypothetical protein ACM3X3_09510 [Betaproteobacteria bacterium]